MFKGFNMVAFDDMLFLTGLSEDEVSRAAYTAWIGCVILAFIVWGVAGAFAAGFFLGLSLIGTTALMIHGLDRRAKNVWRDQLWMYN